MTNPGEDDNPSVAQSYPILAARCSEDLRRALTVAIGESAEPESTSVAALDYGALRVFAEDFSASAAPSLSSFTFQQLVPALVSVANQPLPAGEIKTRLGNRLREHGVNRWEQLLDVSPGEVSLWHNTGANSVAELLGHAIVAGAEGPRAGSAPATVGGQLTTGTDPAIAKLLGSVQEIAAYGLMLDPAATWWQTAAGLQLVSGLPPPVSAALETLQQLPCADLAGSVAATYDLEELTERVLSRLRDREREVIVRRVLPLGETPTLEDLGNEQGVTRERIRQIEASAITKVKRSLGEPALQPIVGAAEQLAVEVGVACRVPDLPGRLGAIVRDVPTTSAALSAHVLAWLAGPYRLVDEWMVRRDAGDLARIVRHQLRTEARDGIVPVADAEATLDRLGFRGSSGRHWLEDDERLRVVGDAVLLWEGGVPDKAELVLRTAGSAMSLDEIHEAINEDKNPRTLANSLGADDRFMRRGKSRWGLTEWGGDEYTSTVDLMLDEIEQRGGEAAVDDLIHVITQRFPDVLPATIATYASTVQFVRTAPGVIRARRPSDPYVSDGRVDLARDCYLIEGHWALRVRVNADHLRGSGFLIPTPFATRLGVRPSDRVEFSSDWGPISISWRTQTAMSSIRSVLIGLGAQEGDLVFLRFAPPAQVDARLVRARDIETATSDGQILLQVGADQFSPDPLLAIGRALGMASPENVSVAELEARLRQKGDEDLMVLLPTHSETTRAAMALMVGDEGQHLEKKETLSWNVRSEQRDKAVEHSAIKTVAGFLNADGGVLYIGVSDDGVPTGVEPDLRVLNMDLDRYELHLRGLLTKNLGDATVSTAVAIRFHPVDEKSVCEVRVDRSPYPAYIPDKNGVLTLFVRSGNQTKALPIDEAVKYIDAHFSGERYAREILEGSAESAPDASGAG